MRCVPQNYLLIRLWNQTLDALVAVQEVLELLIANDKFLCLAEAVLPCVFTFNYQTLEDLLCTLQYTFSAAWL